MYRIVRMYEWWMEGYLVSWQDGFVFCLKDVMDIWWYDKMPVSCDGYFVDGMFGGMISLLDVRYTWVMGCILECKDASMNDGVMLLLCCFDEKC